MRFNLEYFLMLSAADIDSDEVVRNFNPARPDGSCTLNMNVQSLQVLLYKPN